MRGLALYNFWSILSYYLKFSNFWGSKQAPTPKHPNSGIKTASTHVIVPMYYNYLREGLYLMRVLINLTILL
jgi:hypothetical protein